MKIVSAFAFSLFSSLPLSLSFSLPASAAVGDPVVLTTSGVLTATLIGNEGLFSHVLELSSSNGAIVSPIFVGVGIDSFYDLGYAVNTAGDTFNLGYYAAGTELVFRLTNYDGNAEDGGSIVGQLFTGSGALNPAQNGYDAGLPYAKVTYISPTHIQIGFEDLFQDRDTYNNLVFDLQVAQVPVPASAWLFGSGVLGLVGLRRRLAS